MICKKSPWGGRDLSLVITALSGTPITGTKTHHRHRSLWQIIFSSTVPCRFFITFIHNEENNKMHVYEQIMNVCGITYAIIRRVNTCKLLYTFTYDTYTP